MHVVHPPGALGGDEVQAQRPCLVGEAQSHVGARLAWSFLGQGQAHQFDPLEILAVADRVAVQDADLAGRGCVPIPPDQGEQSRAEGPLGVAAEVLGISGPIGRIERLGEGAGRIEGLGLNRQGREQGREQDRPPHQIRPRSRHR
jgi:hypothetical protein